jgi:uncharacterized membrane protein YeaQ/YmgE (transglycosylase-associated protein family)
VPGHDVDLVDLDLARQPHRGSLGDQAAAQLLGHGVHVRHVEAQFLGDLTVRKVQTHEVQAQHPDPQRLVMAGQHRAGEVVKAPRTRLAPIPLPVSLGLVKAIADYGTATAGRAADTLRPAMLAHQGETLGIVDQRREVDQIRGGHDATGSSRGTVRYPAPRTSSQTAWGTLPRPGSITPDPDKSLAGFIASKVVNKTGEGVVLDIVLGIVGAVVGGWLFAAFGGTGVTGFNLYSMFVAVIGAVVVLVVYHAVVGRRTV